MPHLGALNEYPQYIFLEQLKKPEMCQYETDAPANGPSSYVNEHFAKNEIEKWQLKSHHIGGFCLNGTWPIFYDYIPVYKIQI